MIPCTTQGNTKDPAIVVREFVAGYNGLHKCGTKALKSIQGVSGNVGGSCMGGVLYSLVPPMLVNNSSSTSYYLERRKSLDKGRWEKA